jgi:hypothetical protein
LLTRMARSASALTACEPVGELTWGELTLACSPSRGTDGLCAFGRSAGLLGRRASRPGLGRARGPAHRAGPQDHLPIGEGSCSSNRSRRTRSHKAGGRLSGVVMSCPGLVKSMARESRGPAGVWRTQKGRINRSRPGPRSLEWSQAGTAGLREYRPHNQGKARRGNRDSEGPSKQRPRARLCDPKSLRLG